VVSTPLEILHPRPKESLIAGGEQPQKNYTPLLTGFEGMYCFHLQGQTNQAGTQQESIRYVHAASFLLVDCVVYLSKRKMEAVRRSEKSVNFC
jgi:hypothetical protein